MGVPTKEKKSRRGSSTAVSSIGEGEEAQWSKGAAPKGNGNVHGGVDHTQRSGDICGVQRM